MNTPDNKTKRYSTFAVIFYINKSKRKKNGLCPVMGRISVNAETAQFSARIDVDSALWDAKTYRMKGKSREANQVNRELDRLTESIEKYHAELLQQQGYVTAELVKNMLWGIGRKKDTLLSLLSNITRNMPKKSGSTERKKPTATMWWSIIMSVNSCKPAII